MVKKIKFLTTLEEFGLFDYMCNTASNGCTQYEVTVTYKNKPVLRLHNNSGTAPTLTWLVDEAVCQSIGQRIRNIIEQINNDLHAIHGNAITRLEVYSGGISTVAANVVMLFEIISELDCVIHDDTNQLSNASVMIINCDNRSLLGDVRATEHYAYCLWGTKSEVQEATKDCDANLCLNMMKYDAYPVYCLPLTARRRIRHLTIKDIHEGLMLAKRIKTVMYG